MFDLTYLQIFWLLLITLPLGIYIGKIEHEIKVNFYGYGILFLLEVFVLCKTKFFELTSWPEAVWVSMSICATYWFYRNHNTTFITSKRSVFFSVANTVISIAIYYYGGFFS